jgi:hypothetical protein
VAGAFMLALGHRGATLRDVSAGAFFQRGAVCILRQPGLDPFAAGGEPLGNEPEEVVMRELVTRRLLSLSARSGQGTVEYVGLILLVALLMVGMVAAMKGFQGKQGLELAQTIVDKIREAVGQVSFK